MLNFNSQQNQAYDSILRGENVFITGPAGTGKSHIIKSFMQNKPSRRVVALTSTTGTSALLIGGTTLHSYLKIGLGTQNAAVLAEQIRKSVFSRDRWLKLNTLIIDEVSMLSAQLFDKLEEVARLVRNNDLPFGGIQLVLSGDFLQLPCIDVNSVKFVFDAKTWNMCIKRVFYLTEIFRQSDPVYQAILNEIRVGKISENSIDIMETRLGAEIVNSFGIKPTELFPLNRDVDAINNEELDKLANDGAIFYEYNMQVTIKPKFRNIRGLLEKFYKYCNAPVKLQLCIGAQVMLLKNLDLESGLANGSRGVITDFIEELPIVTFMNGVERIIDYYDYVMEEDGEKMVTAKQVPLRVAYALTIHKSQGCTMDCVKMDLNTVFEYGQAYVALSRVKSLTGLSIKKADWNLIKAHPYALDYYSRLQ